MANAFGVPEISADQVAKKLENKDNFILLDVREPFELRIASVVAAISAPLSLLAEQGAPALPSTVRDNQMGEIVVMCHHGSRSAQVTAWLRQQGYQNAINLNGGIHAWSVLVDPAVPTY
jgi:rhodanese-related sulfurtransferase